VLIIGFILEYINYIFNDIHSLNILLTFPQVSLLILIHMHHSHPNTSILIDENTILGKTVEFLNMIKLLGNNALSLCLITFMNNFDDIFDSIDSQLDLLMFEHRQ